MATENTQNKTTEGIGREEEIYRKRFSDGQENTRSVTWRVLMNRFFQPRIAADSVVVDIGAGDGLFIKNIVARKRIAVDLSPHVKALESDGIEVHVKPATVFSTCISEPADVIFMSNFLEHLPTKQLVLDVLDECLKALKPGGVVMILQPNIRYVGPAYWDYIDHHIALTEHSLVEALNISGFSVKELIPRFLPYTAKSKVGLLAGTFPEAIVKLYLNMPILWRFFGQQTFIVGQKKGEIKDIL